MATSASSRPVQRFGGFEVDPRSRELRRKGKRIRMQDQPLEVLLLLLERSGEVVTREELKQRLWPADTFVESDDGLNTAIRKLREALGDSAEKPKFIETIPRRGYRFIGTLEQGLIQQENDGNARAGADPAEPAEVAYPDLAKGSLRGDTKSGHSAVRRWTVGGAIVLALLLLGVTVAYRRISPRGQAQSQPAGISSLAVLPFQNLSNDDQQEYFAEGMTEALITNLAELKSLRVISHTSAMHYKDTSETLPQIAHELNVDGIVEGTIQRYGGRIQLTVSLVRAQTESTIWSHKYERSSQDVLLLQSELAEAIASEVATQATPQERHRIANPTAVNPAAYDEYLLGLYLSRKRTPAAIERAMEHFRGAIRIEPRFAKAYAGLAQAYLEREIWAGTGIGRSGAEVRAAAIKALELDSDLAEGHALMARIHFEYDWDWNATEEEYQRSIGLNAGIPETHEFYAFFLQSMGRQEEALAEAHRAVELDPLSPSCLSDEGRIFYRARQYERAIVDYKRALEIDPAFVPALSRIGEAYDQEGKFDEALRSVRQYQHQAFDPRVALPYLARIYAHLEKRHQAVQILKEIEADHDHPRNEPAMIAAYAALGDRDRAISLLDGAIKAKSVMPFIFVDPPMDSLRSDPRFNDLVRRAGLH